VVYWSYQKRRCVMRQKVWIMFSLFLVLGLVLAGCGDRMTAEEIVDRMRETVDSTQDAHGVVTVKLNAQGTDMSVTAEIWEKSPNKLRAVVLDASEPGLAGTTMVSDGQQAWYYEPERNRVMVGQAGEIEMPLPQEALSGLQEVIQEVLDVSNVELAGEEEVAGRDTYKLTLSPKEDTDEEVFPGDGIATLWVDQEQWIVLKATYEADVFGQGGMEVQSFELNPGLDDALFTFEIPEGATVVDVEAQQPVPLTLDEAKAQAEFPLLVPEYVPGGATLIEVFKMGDSIILRYDHSPDVSFAIVQGSELSELAPLETQVAAMTARVQDITVRGHTGTAISDEAGGNTIVYWTENYVTVTVVGHVGLDEALQVAESLQ
jgi:outer membrane lipoprotein-sorting protein